MQWTSVLAIYALFWVMCAFLMLPFGVKTHDEAGLEKTRGQADSAPANFRLGRHLLRAAAVAAVVCALFYANYVNGWIEMKDLNLFGKPPGIENEPAIYRN
jgi:predicted secreted protein